jgi:peptidoglycan/xylan/chitin deacetylase (PgdA/CDA1 family)
MTIKQQIRMYARKLILDVAGTFSVPKKGIHILNGHTISCGKFTGESTGLFRALLQELSHYVQFIRFEEAVKLILQKTEIDKPIVAFSFDDGFTDCLPIAAVLQEFGVNAAFFINPNFVEGNQAYINDFLNNTVLTSGKIPMRWNEIKRLQIAGHIIGAHTMDHYRINTSDIETLNYQIKYCKEVIERNLGVACDYFAFPYGRLEHANNLSIEMACESYPYVFSQSNYKHYFSFDGKVINRRHFEPFWPLRHVKYFLNARKQWD